MVGLTDFFFFLDRFSKIRVEIFKLLYILKALIRFILHIADMVAKKLIFLAAFDADYVIGADKIGSPWAHGKT